MNLDKCKKKKAIEKSFFKTNQDYYLVQQKKDFHKIKNRLVLLKDLYKIQTRETTPEATTEPTKRKKLKLKLQQEFMNGIIAKEKDINDELLWNYFRYQNPSFLLKDLTRATQTKNEQLANNVKDGLIDLRNAIIKKRNFRK